MANPRLNPDIAFYNITLHMLGMIAVIRGPDGTYKKNFLDKTFYAGLKAHLENSALEILAYPTKEEAQNNLIGTRTTMGDIDPKIPAVLECKMLKGNKAEIYSLSIKHTDKSVITLLFPSPISITLDSVKKGTGYLPDTRKIITANTARSIASFESFMGLKDAINDLFKEVANKKVRDILTSPTISEKDEAAIDKLHSKKYSLLLDLHKKINALQNNAPFDYHAFKHDLKHLLQAIKQASADKKFFHFLGFKSNVEVKAESILKQYFDQNMANVNVTPPSLFKR